MNEELQAREGTEKSMIAKDNAATFTPFEMHTDGDVSGLSDDDIAAALGYHTTLSEPLLPQDADMTDQQGESGETTDESPDTAAAAEEAPDDGQGKEIEDIRSALESLKADIENDDTRETTEDTGVTE